MGNKVLLSMVLMLIGFGVLPGQELHESIAFYQPTTAAAPNLDPREVKKDTEGNYYFILNEKKCNQTLIGDVEVECQVWEGAYFDKLQTYLVKLDENLSLDTFITIKGEWDILWDITVSSEKILVAYRSVNYVDRDTILIGQDSVIVGPGSGVFSFTHELEYEGVLIEVGSRVNNIASKEDRLFIQGYFGSTYDGQELYTLIEGDTLWNFGGQEGTPSSVTPYVISYDLQGDTVETFWKMGSDGHCYILDMLVDHSGDLVMAFDAGYAGWFDFNGPELVTTNQYRGDYLLKYHPDGELVFFEEFSLNLSNLYLGEEEGYYVVTGVNGDGWTPVNGDTIHLCGTDPEISHTVKGIVAKFNNSGILQWYYNDGCAQIASIWRIHEKGGVLSCATKYSDPGFELQGQPYFSEGRYSGIVNLDAETGMPISHKLSPINDDFRHFYIERIEGDRYRTFAALYGADNYFGLPVGVAGDNMSYFLEFSLDMLTSSKEIPSWSSPNFQLFPNPTHAGATLKISDIPAGAYTVAVHSITGKLIYQESVHLQVGMNALAWQPAVAGVYAVSLTSESGQYTGMVVVER